MVQTVIDPTVKSFCLHKRDRSRSTYTLTCPVVSSEINHNVKLGYQWRTNRIGEELVDYLLKLIKVFDLAC